MKKFITVLAAFLLSLSVGNDIVSAQDGSYPQSQPEEIPFPQNHAGPPPSYGQSQANQGDDSQQADPSQPGVARISVIQGDVSSQRGDNGDWVAATVNTPVEPDDRVSTGQGARAELQLDYANSLRLASGATAKVATLNRSNIQVQIGQGLVSYSVLDGAEAAPEIDTPNASIRPNGPGEYRILVNSDSETEVIIRRGSADISTSQGSEHVNQGQMITVAGTDDAQYKIDPAPGRDDWDSWNDNRDRQIQSASSWHNTNRYYTGSEDLDRYGHWTNVPDYGQVWVPAAGPDWAPYRDGRWVYEPYYGWTWVSYEPWGWAPYHYGRWFVYGGSWAWWPGPVYSPGYYPVWAPAYVSFFGFGGGGWGVSVGFGGGFGRYGWLPCGPGDWYHPWYGRWGNRVNVVNVTNIHNNFHEGFGPLGGNRGNRFSNVDEAFRNDRVRSGFSSMGGNEFGRGAVPGHQRGISEGEFRQASFVGGRMPVTPSRESFSPSGRQANPSSFRSAPPASQRFFAGGMHNNLSGVRPAGNGNNGDRGSSNFGGNRNNSSFDRPNGQVNENRANENRGNVPSNPQSGARSGWRTFTPPSSENTNRSGGDFNRGPAQNNRGTDAAPSRGGFEQQQSRQSSNDGFRGQTQQQPQQPQQNQNRGGWSTFSAPSRDSGRQGFSGSGQQQQPRVFNSPSQRQSLNMRQPVVTPRGNQGGGYNAPRGSSNAPRPAYNAPAPSRGGGSFSQPPRGNSGGGGHSRDSNGGGGHRR